MLSGIGDPEHLRAQDIVKARIKTRTQRSSTLTVGAHFGVRPGAAVRFYPDLRNEQAATLTDATQRCAGVSWIVTVGSGTLADIGKAVSTRLDDVSHVVVQTATSVNGFAVPARRNGRPVSATTASRRDRT